MDTAKIPNRARSIDQEPEETTQQTFPIASFEVTGRRIAFPLVDDDLDGKNRIVQHVRPYRNGAKLDDTYSDADCYTMRAIFNNTIEEQGLESNGGMPLYPDVMNLLIELGKVHATGDLIVPVDGKKRVRLDSFQRSHRVEEKNTGYLVLKFVVDNEDKIDGASFSKPTVTGRAIRLADRAIATSGQIGSWNGDLLSFREFCAELEGLIRTPGEYSDAIHAQVRAALRAATQVIIAPLIVTHERANEERFLPMELWRDLTEAKDIISFSVSEKTKDPRLIPFYVTQPTTIFAIASSVGQPVELLMEVNVQKIDDPFFVEPGKYQVYEFPP